MVLTVPLVPLRLKNHFELRGSSALHLHCAGRRFGLRIQLLLVLFLGFFSQFVDSSRARVLLVFLIPLTFFFGFEAHDENSQNRRSFVLERDLNRKRKHLTRYIL